MPDSVFEEPSSRYISDEGNDYFMLDSGDTIVLNQDIDFSGQNISDDKNGMWVI
jgi:hypothetical protein